MAERRRPRILLIDDEYGGAEDDSKVVSLREKGFDVTVVNKPEKVAVAISEAGGNFDAVLLDIMMPCDGYSTVQATQGGRFTGALVLKEIRIKLGNVPVLVVSAHNESEARPHLGDIAGFLEKPVSASRIAERLSDLLASEK